MANYDNIIARTSAAVPDATNNSAASIWRRIVAVFASVIDILQLEMTRSQTRIEQAARNLRVMGKQYCTDTAFAYQDGDALTVVDEETLREGYAIVDTAKQIIKQAAVSTPDTGQIYIKVATTDSDGNLTALTAGQLSAFQSYMSRFTPIGMELTVFSADPDVLGTTNLYIYYSSDYSLTTIQGAMVQTLQQFQTAFNPDVPVYINDIENAIKSIAGIRDAYFDGIKATYTDAGGSHTELPVNGTLELHAGYFNFDPAIYDWTDNITVFTAV
jgi:hypothetical protein